MCHFHSVCINRQGKIAHTARNSHSAAAQKAKWHNAAAVRQDYWEWEWDGRGDPPKRNALQIRDHTPTGPIPSAVDRAAAKHVENLIKARDTGVLAPIFKQPEYRDVQQWAKEKKDARVGAVKIRQKLQSPPLTMTVSEFNDLQYQLDVPIATLLKDPKTHILTLLRASDNWPAHTNSATGDLARKMLKKRKWA